MFRSWGKYRDLWVEALAVLLPLLVEELSLTLCSRFLGWGFRWSYLGCARGRWSTCCQVVDVLEPVTICLESSNVLGRVDHLLYLRLRSREME